MTSKTYLKLLPNFLINPNPEQYLGNNYVVIDFETTNISKGDPGNENNSIVFASWILGDTHPQYTKGKSIYSTFATEYELGQLVEAIEQADFFVAHNSKFEYGWLERCGLDISKKLAYCTMLGEYVIAGNRKWNLDLDSVLSNYDLDGKESVVSKMMKNGICPSIIPKSWLAEYGEKDTVQTHKLFLLQRQKLKRNGLLPTAFTRNIFSPVLSSLEKTGVHLDADRVKVVHDKVTKDLVELERKLNKITGGINTKSPPQKAEFLYKTLGFPIPKDFKGNPLLGKNKNEIFPDGIPKTDKTVIAKLKPRNKKQREFLYLLAEVNKTKDALSKSLTKFYDCVTTTQDHIIRADYNQALTGTHRLSSSGRQFSVQLQNLANEFKPVFSPRYEGWEIGEADEAQLEYRVAVCLSKDEVGYNDIINKVDAHGFTASIIFKEEWQDCNADKHTAIGKKVRTDSKPHTFKPLYGGSSGTPREKEYYQAFRDKHKGITETQSEWVSEVYNSRVLTTITGLKFYWKDAKLNSRGTLIRPDGRPADQSICNYPVQSFAGAEIVPIAVTYLWHLMRVAEMQSFLVNTVHDSAVAEIFPPEKELYETFAVQSFTILVKDFIKKVYGFDFYVPLEAEVEFNTHWSTYPEWENKWLQNQ